MWMRAVDMDMDTVTNTNVGIPMIKCKGITPMLLNQSLFVVTSDDFVTFKIARNSMCDRAGTVKNWYR